MLFRSRGPAVHSDDRGGALAVRGAQAASLRHFHSSPSRAWRRPGVGIAVLPSPRQASDALRALPAGATAAAVRAVPFGHTLAGSFRDASRQLSAISAAGPYQIGRAHV